MSHSDRVCRAVSEPVTGSFFPCSEDVGNHLFPDIVGDQPAGSLHGIFGGVPRPTPRGVLDPSPYAYLEAVSLVLANAIEAFAALAERLDALAEERRRPWWRRLVG